MLMKFSHFSVRTSLLDNVLIKSENVLAAFKLWVKRHDSKKANALLRSRIMLLGTVLLWPLYQIYTIRHHLYHTEDKVHH